MLLVMLTHLIQERKEKGLELIWGIYISLCKFLEICYSDLGYFASDLLGVAIHFYVFIYLFLVGIL